MDPGINETLSVSNLLVLLQRQEHCSTGACSVTLESIAPISDSWIIYALTLVHLENAHTLFFVWFVAARK